MVYWTIVKYLSYRPLTFYIKLSIFNSYSNMWKLFGKKKYLNIKSNILKLDPPTIYITVISWILSGLSMYQLFYNL